MVKRGLGGEDLLCKSVFGHFVRGVPAEAAAHAQPFHGRAGWVGWVQPRSCRRLGQVERRFVSAISGELQKGRIRCGQSPGARGCWKARGQGEYLSLNTSSPCQGCFSGVWEHAKQEQHDGESSSTEAKASHGCRSDTLYCVLSRV